VATVSEGTTRERLIDAAIDLFGERGFAETSVQALTAAARANLAAVNYHFGSKEGLLRVAIHRVIDPVNAAQLAALDRLEAGAAPPTTRQIVEVFLTPFFTLLGRDTPEGRRAGRLMGHVLGTANSSIRAMLLGEVAPVAGRFIAALARSRPDLSEGELTRRFASMMGALMVHQIGIVESVPFFPVASQAETQAWILQFVTAGFSAPPASLDPLHALE
jgi:AcrR family transcriptional regulator